MTDTPHPSPARQRASWLIWAFAAVGVAAALAVIWIAIMMGTAFDRRPPARIAAQTPNQTLTVGTVEEIPGTGLVAIGIDGAEGRDGVGSIKSSYQDRRNILFLDQASGRTHRVLPDNKAQIIETSYLPATKAMPDESSSRTGAPLPASYYVIQLTRAKGMGIDLLVGQFDGFRQTIIMQGLGGIDRMWMLDDHRLAIILREKQKLFYRVIDIPAQKVLSSQPIAIE